MNKLEIAQIETFCGPVSVLASSKGITGIYFSSIEELISKVPADCLLEQIPWDRSPAAIQLLEYFNGTRKTFSLPLDLKGTSFQKKVWVALQEIPYGSTVTYKDIAEHIGCPKGCRAVGQANGRNPVPIVIPCHRVLAADGKLGGYSCGLDKKTALLRLEGCL